jgi:hypothetical protein
MNVRSAMTTVIILVAAAAFAGCGSSDATSSKTTTTATATIPPNAGTGSKCSASKLDIAGIGDKGLPRAVATTRQRIIYAAYSCDFDALAKIADEHKAQFAFEQGAGSTTTTAADYWRSVDAKDKVMARVVQLLTSTSAISTEGPKTYVWPAVQAGTRTDSDWQALIESGAYTEQEVGAMRKDDLYYGYRIGILPNGTWTYLTAGG